MSERNGDRARFQKERMRKMHRRQRIQALVAAVQQRKDAASASSRRPRGDGISEVLRCHAQRRRSDALWRLSKHVLRSSPRSWRTACFLRALLMSWLRRHQSLAPEKPLRDELLSIERLEERALALAARFTVDPDPRRRPRDTFPRFEDNVRVLRGAYRTLADDVRNGQFVVFGRGLAPRQLPPGRGRDFRHPPESAAHRTRARCRRWRRASTPVMPASTRSRSS